MDYVVMTEKMTFGKHRRILNAIDVLSKKAYSRSPLTDAGRHCADGSTDAEVSQGDLRSEL